MYDEHRTRRTEKTAYPHLTRLSDDPEHSRKESERLNVEIPESTKGVVPSFARIQALSISSLFTTRSFGPTSPTRVIHHTSWPYSCHLPQRIFGKLLNQNTASGAKKQPRIGKPFHRGGNFYQQTGQRRVIQHHTDLDGPLDHSESCDRTILIYAFITRRTFARRADGI